MKLKTLKDISSWHGEVKSKELRAEAVKWIKEDRYCSMEEELSFEESEKRWMKRFNINEGDLEDE